MKHNYQGSSFDDLMKRLEAERNDLSYRKRLAPPEEKIVIKQVRKVPERLKKVYFHAGRFAAGDRDSLAIDANKEFEKLENE